MLQAECCVQEVHVLDQSQPDGNAHKFKAHVDAYGGSARGRVQCTVIVCVRPKRKATFFLSSVARKRRTSVFD